MHELGYIQSQEYDDACLEVDSGLEFKNGNIKNDTKNEIYSYHTDALISQIILDISKNKKISESFANNYIEMAGLKIYSTQVSNIQDIMEKEFSSKKYLLESSLNPGTSSQAAMIIIDHSTGSVVRVCWWIR